MKRFAKVNNERSETIELIKLMDSIVKQNTWQIRSIGGESTLNTGEQRMFPDVFIYGDLARTQILQGWEVKMPDVPITDADFIFDAQRKADVLGVNSCIIWNFTFGALYVKNSDCWNKVQEWNKTDHIRTRSDVATYRTDWEAMIADILAQLSGFFLSGELRPAKIGDIVTDTIFTELIKRNKAIVAENLQAASIVNTVIAAHISQWWRSVEKEYKFDEVDKFQAYAKYLLLNWINKFTFANMIKSNHNPAAVVETISEDTSPSDALEIFKAITEKCDFFNIFEAVTYGEVLPDATWTDLTDYNAFLSENGLSQIPQSALQSVLESTVNQFKRSVSGVFTTPQKLAEILVNAGIADLTAPTIDPCCGTGTIAKEIITAKESAIGIKNAVETTYASDKFSFPLQISNIAMTRTSAINIPSLLFRENAFELSENKEIEITNPVSGTKTQYYLPKLGNIISNLPFVAFDQEGREESNNIAKVLEHVRSESGINLSGRADLYQALLLHFHKLLADNANVAVITSNSWLGTLAGQEFFRVLNYYYSVESIVVSGNGKWFDNADVITLMLFLTSKPTPNMPNAMHTVNFGLLYKEVSTLTDDDTSQIIDSIKLRRTVSPELLSFKPYSLEKIDNMRRMNIALNALFYDIDWLLDVKDSLCPITELFEIIPGIKTGQDEIYFIPDAECVDAPYIGNIFKTAKESEYLVAQADTLSFVCDKSIDELMALGHKKTLNWINRFAGHINQSVLNRDTFWMNFGISRFPDSKRVRLFAPMNPERRIFYGLLDKPEKTNQRATGFKPIIDSVNLELCHALLNSAIGIFYTEAMGFPKGLGALDTRRKNTEKMLMLNPRLLSENDISRILEAFRPLLARKIMTTEQEYQQVDRLAFEHIVAECFRYTNYLERIKNCFLEMQRVRLSVR